MTDADDEQAVVGGVRGLAARLHMRNVSRRSAVGLAGLGVVFMALLIAAEVRSQGLIEAAEGQAARYRAPALAGVQTAAPAAPAVVAVLADSGRFADSAGPSWTARLEALVAGDVHTGSSSGLRYVADDGTTFAELAAKVPRDADVVVFFGGAEDADAEPLKVLQAATQAFGRATARARGARIVVVGPLPGPVGGPSLVRLRRTLRLAATIVDARWVDPVADGWVPSSDGGRLSDSELQEVMRDLTAATASDR